MAKNELIESAKQIESRTAELLERVKLLQNDLGASLQQAKRHELKLIEAEKAAAKAKAEREREERRKEFLESEQQTGFYSSGSDEDETPEVKPAEPKRRLLSPRRRPNPPSPKKSPRRRPQSPGRTVRARRQSPGRRGVRPLTNSVRAPISPIPTSPATDPRPTSPTATRSPATGSLRVRAASQSPPLPW